MTLKNNNPQHVLTHEDRSKGGKKLTLRQRIARRKKCNSTCPIYPCMFQALAEREDKCIMRIKASNYTLKMIESIILGGRSGAEELFKQVIAKMTVKSNEKDLVWALDKFIRSVYGERREIEGNLSVNTRKEIVEEMLKDDDTTTVPKDKETKG